MPSLPLAMELDHHPTSEELREAMSKLKRGKAAGRTGILPELLLHGGAELQDRLHALANGRCVEEGKGLARCRNSLHTQEGRSQEV